MANGYIRKAGCSSNAYVYVQSKFQTLHAKYDCACYQRIACIHRYLLVTPCYTCKPSYTIYDDFGWHMPVQLACLLTFPSQILNSTFWNRAPKQPAQRTAATTSRCFNSSWRKHSEDMQVWQQMNMDEMHHPSHDLGPSRPKVAINLIGSSDLSWTTRWNITRLNQPGPAIAEPHRPNGRESPASFLLYLALQPQMAK